VSLPYYTDEAGRVIERATGLRLGRVDEVTYRPVTGDGIYVPRDVEGEPLGRPTMLRSIAMLRVVRAARPGVEITLWDIDERPIR